MLQLRFKQDGPPAVDLNQPRISIGRDKTNQVILETGAISGFHAEIQVDDGKVYLVDLGSTNGTFVNGKPVSGRQLLQVWDSLRFEKIEAEIVDTEKRRPTMVSKAVTDADLARAATGATQVRPAVGGWALVGKSGPLAGRSFALTAKLVVGRDQGVEVKIDDPSVSRRHAELVLSGSGVSIKDLGSANGTFVNGKKVTQAAVQAGDELAFDKMIFRLEGPVKAAAQTVVRPAVGGAAATVTGPAPAAGGTLVTPAVGSALLKDAKGKTYPLAGTVVTIGRTAENTICLDDDTVSSRHAQLSVDKGSWVLEDLGATNGTFINGQKITRQPLKNADSLRFGKVELSFTDSPAANSATRVTEAVSDVTRTSVHQTPKKGLPAWAYGLIGFLIVGAGLGIFLQTKGTSSPVIDAKLQGGKAWVQQLSAGRTTPTTPVLADINGDKFLDVIVADAGGYVLAMDGAEGKKIFEAEAADRILAPPVAGDLSGDGVDDLVVASNSGLVVALNGSGQTLWKSEGNLALGAIINRPALASLNDDKIPDVIVPTSNRGLVALDGARGWKIWDTADMTLGKLITSPLVADVNGDGLQDFVAVSDQGQVLAVTSQNGKVWQLWQAMVPKIYYASPAMIKAGDKLLVVVATDAGGIIALNADTGRPFWSAAVNKRFFASPVTSDANGDGVADLVLAAANGDIHVLDGLSGDEIWSMALGTPIQATPALFDANNDGLRDLILLDTSGHIQIVDMARGRVILPLDVIGADAFVASPLLGDVNNDGLLEVVTASQNGQIAAYGLNRTTSKSQALWPMFLGNNRHGLE